MLEFEIPEERESSEWRKMYESVLTSDRWRNLIRPMVLQRAGSKCERCGSADGLSIHHVTYANLGKELPRDLLALCERCHEVADRYRELMAFGAWLKNEGKSTMTKPVPIPGPFPSVGDFLEKLAMLGLRVELAGELGETVATVTDDGGLRCYPRSALHEMQQTPVLIFIREHYDEIVNAVKATP